MVLPGLLPACGVWKTGRAGWRHLDPARRNSGVATPGYEVNFNYQFTPLAVDILRAAIESDGYE
ncbi:TPA: hypothetical protein ACWZSZ_002974 [Escherichia coli]